MPHFSAEILDDDLEGALLLRDVLGPAEPARGRAGLLPSLKPADPAEAPLPHRRGGRAGVPRPVRPLSAAAATSIRRAASCPRS
ncbi:hypothetical protein [Methylobacterium oryzisoli]|uniref:hypothetical protein n=1 Tax=Methylobacterium oryzisoli TaxID=3385502 RepID=UPI00389210CF